MGGKVSAPNKNTSGFSIKRGRSQQMSTAPAQGGVYADKASVGRRSGGAVMSASRRNVPLPGQSRIGAPGQIQGAPSKSMLFPPLNETSFSEQYKTFKALGGQQKRIPMANNLEMSKDLQMRINPVAQNRPYYKRNFRGPPFGSNDLNPLMASNMHNLPPGLLPSADQSVFQTNASHVLSSPNATLNMMGDASTAPYFTADQSMIQRSPPGKFFHCADISTLMLTLFSFGLDMMELQRQHHQLLMQS